MQIKNYDEMINRFTTDDCKIDASQAIPSLHKHQSRRTHREESKSKSRSSSSLRTLY
eukprot:UN02052